MSISDPFTYGQAGPGRPAPVTHVPQRGGRGSDWKQPARRPMRSRLNPSDVVFRTVARTGGSVMLVLMLLIGAFLAFRAWQALRVAGWSFLTTASWAPGAGAFGIAAVMVGTFLIAGTAVVFAVPLSIGTALYLSEYAPASIKRFLVSVIDLMAAVPSVIFGLWGFQLLQWKLTGLSEWLNNWLGWIPLFQVPGVQRGSALISPTSFTSSSFDAGLVVALMITPIISSVMREAFSQAPAGEREGAYALGATRWGMIRSVVLPFGRGAMIGGTMLGLGRALGETLAVTLVISAVYSVQPHILEHGTSSVSSLIALHYGESTPLGISALMAAGLALFAITLLVNFIAAQIVARSRSGAQSE
jgi:phosphate transport system permease protein